MVFVFCAYGKLVNGVEVHMNEKAAKIDEIFQIGIVENIHSSLGIPKSTIQYTIEIFYKPVDGATTDLLVTAAKTGSKFSRMFLQMKQGAGTRITVEGRI